MMPRKIWLFLLIALIGLFFNHCEQKTGTSDSDKTTLVLVNPSAWSFNSFLKLIEMDIINIPNLHCRVIYDKNSGNRLEGAERALQNYPALSVQLEMIPGIINEETLYRENEFSGHFRQIFSESDGILFFGGDDIPPKIFGEKTSLLTDIETPHRHYFELSLLFHLLGGSQNQNMAPLLEQKPEYVVFGFCLGLQTMNVATGGTMVQDIPSDLYNMKYVEDVLKLDPDQQHHNYWADLYPEHGVSGYQFHRINLLPNQFWVNTLKMNPDFQPLVYSNHHQALGDIGMNLVAGATSPDGKVIESIHHVKYPHVLGVQFHPENYLLYDSGGATYKQFPEEENSRSAYDVLNTDESLDFHYSFWTYFSELFNEI